MATNLRRRKPRSLTQLIGADFNLLKESGSPVVKNFYWSAFILLLIIALTFYSVREAMNMLFHNTFVEITFSIFFSGLFLLMYIFLLNTFSKQSFETRKNIYSAANLSRFGFIIFMAFTISKPVEIKLLNGYVNAKTEQYKVDLLHNYTLHLDSLTNGDIMSLTKRMNYLKEQQYKYSSLTIEQEISGIENKLTAINDDKNSLINAANQKISKADCFVYKIRSVSKNIIGWCIALVILSIFIMPGYLIYSIPEDDIYYKTKKQIEDDIIINDYAIFLQQYTRLFQDKYKTTVTPYSVYENPPFNTKRKTDNKFKKQKDFFDSFFNPA